MFVIFLCTSFSYETTKYQSFIISYKSCSKYRNEFLKSMIDMQLLISTHSIKKYRLFIVSVPVLQTYDTIYVFYIFLFVFPNATCVSSC